VPTKCALGGKAVESNISVVCKNQYFIFIQDCSVFHESFDYAEQLFFLGSIIALRGRQFFAKKAIGRKPQGAVGAEEVRKILMMLFTEDMEVCWMTILPIW